MSSAIDQLIDKLSLEIECSLDSAFKENEILKNSNEIKKIVSWVKEVKEKHDDKTFGDHIQGLAGSSSAPLTLSYKINENPTKSSENDNDTFKSPIFFKIVSKIAELLSKKISSHLIQLMIKNVKVKTSDSKKSVTFDMSVSSEPIKPYVEFVKTIDGAEIQNVKTIFHVDFDVKTKNLGLKIDSTGEKQVVIDKIIIKMTVSLLTLANITISKKALKLCDSNIEIDASKYTLNL